MSLNPERPNVESGDHNCTATGRRRDFESVGSVLNSVESTTLITELLAEIRKDAGVGETGVDREELRRILFGKDPER
jgi:hypothetical protein